VRGRRSNRYLRPLIVALAANTAEELNRFSRQRAFALLCALALSAAAGCSQERDLPRWGSDRRDRDAGARSDAGKATDTWSRNMDGKVPPIALGFDAYRQWQQMYRVRIGTRTYMRSTYDRAGGNEGADASHFLRVTPDYHVALDVAGPGVVSFVRTNHWHGSPWHYVVDGRDQIVTESSTADPNNPVTDSRFMPAAAFPEPLAYTWSATRGADLSWVPIGFTDRFTLGYERTHYGTGYYIYQSVPLGSRDLLSPLRAWDAGATAPAVRDLLLKAGEDIAADTVAMGGTGSGGVDEVPAGKLVSLDDTNGSGVLVALHITLPRDQALAADSAHLRITWDDEDEPSVDAPLPLFFGTGTFYNRNGSEWLVRSLLLNVRFTADELQLSSYVPMPFLSRMRIELVGGDQPLTNVRFEDRVAALDDPPSWVAPFHATYVDHGEPVAGKDLVLLDTTQVEGGGHDYCGTFVGTSFIFSDRAELSTLEGDPRFFFDDSESPQGYGTGTEEWAGGGDYWGGETMTLPLAGHPVGAPSALLAQAPEDQIESAYRLLIADAMPFGRNARIQLEHGGANESSEHYRSVVYWYGRKGACLVPSDQVQIGDLADERAHDYVSPTAAEPYELRSRYELGVDEGTPEQSVLGRTMTGTSELSFAIDPDNLGVLLRRTLDYAVPDQRAQVFVKGDGEDDWRPAGTWYLAGSNRCVYSNPLGELDPPDDVVQTSDRRLRDDELLIDRALTAGRSRIRVRIVFDPEGLPLFVGDQPPVPPAWSELRYRAYSWVL
jgi:hypothetical protein